MLLHLEKYITASYSYIISYVYNYLIKSDLTLKEVAKELNIKEKELKKQFEQIDVSWRTLLKIIEILEKYAQDKLEEVKQLKEQENAELRNN